MTRPIPPIRARALLALALLSTVAALASCGGDQQTAPPSGAGLAAGTKATLVLDFVPNAVHTGIYCAARRGYYDEANIDLKIVEPTSTADTLKLIDAGKADFGIADAVDIADQIARGRGAKAVMALVQRPLGGLIALRSSGITDPAQLEGRTVGVTGVPSDDAILDTEVRDAGADPSGVDRVTVGFNGVQSLENGNVDAITGFIAADGTQVEQDGFPITSFPLDEHGGPSYPGLVVFTTEQRIAADPALIAAFVAATVRGYEAVDADPRGCLDELLAANPELDPGLQRAQLEAYLPLLGAGDPDYGRFRKGSVTELSAFLVRSGILDEPIAFDRYATNRFVPEAGGTGG